MGGGHTDGEDQGNPVTHRVRIKCPCMSNTNPALTVSGGGIPVLLEAKLASCWFWSYVFSCYDVVASFFFYFLLETFRISALTVARPQWVGLLDASGMRSKRWCQLCHKAPRH